MRTLNVVIASTRPGRVGLPVAQWFIEQAKAHGKFEVVVSDLKEIALPPIDEPRHPRLQTYEHAHTKAWSETVARSDAFAFVTPEYNFGSPPALVNALDYLYVEWNYKAAGLVTYGGVSGGTRSAQMTKSFLSALKMVPLVEAVAIPGVASRIDGDKFQGEPGFVKAAHGMLDELLRWTEALAVLRGG